MLGTFLFLLSYPFVMRALGPVGYSPPLTDLSNLATNFITLILYLELTLLPHDLSYPIIPYLISSSAVTDV